MYKNHPYPYYPNTPTYGSDNMYSLCKMYPCPYCAVTPMYIQDFYRSFEDEYAPFTDEMDYNPRVDSNKPSGDKMELKDYGPNPYVVNINAAAKQNNTFRTALWTGNHLQVTLMSIPVGEDIGLEVHPAVDQFIRIEEGQGLVKMGDTRYNLNFQRRVGDDFAIMIPAGTWHNIINTGNTPLKLYSIYAPPQHPRGTVHKTKAEAEAAEKK